MVRKKHKTKWHRRYDLSTFDDYVDWEDEDWGYLEPRTPRFGDAMAYPERRGNGPPDWAEDLGVRSQRRAKLRAADMRRGIYRFGSIPRGVEGLENTEAF